MYKFLLEKYKFSIFAYEFFKVTALLTVSNQEVTLKRLISMLQIAQKLFVGALSDLCEMYKLFIQQCG